MKNIVLLMTVAGSFVFASNGEALIKEKCATCHTLSIPTMEILPSFKAPPMDAVMFHMKDVIKGEKNLKAFIADYVYNPDVSKSVCESNKVQKFGVMPSQKGKVNQEELALISDYMIATYPRKKFIQNLNEILKNDEITALRNSPFLINSENLPHMTKLLIQNWDKAKLGLSDVQKSQLIVIRKNTIGGIKKLKKQIKFLEFEIAEAMRDRESVESVEKEVEEVAKLKTEATMIHLKCIANTMAVLKDKQVAFLLPMWE